MIWFAREKIAESSQIYWNCLLNPTVIRCIPRWGQTFGWLEAERAEEEERLTFVPSTGQGRTAHDNVFMAIPSRIVCVCTDHHHEDGLYFTESLGAGFAALRVMNHTEYAQQILTRLPQAPAMLSSIEIDDGRRNNAGRCMTALACNRLASAR